MNKKTFVIFLILSVVVWYISKYIVALSDILIFKNFNMTFFGDNCSPTGYPIFYCTNNETSLFITSLLNIIFWFIILFGIWKLIGKLLKK